MLDITTSNNKNKLNFKDWMAPKGCDSLEMLFEMLSDNGIAVGNTADDFLADGELALFDADQLGCNLVVYGNWLMAKVTAYEELKESGFDGVKAQSDHAEIISVKHDYDEVYFEGEWCRAYGIIYASLDGIIEVETASERGTKRERHAADLSKASWMLNKLYQHRADISKSA